MGDVTARRERQRSRLRINSTLQLLPGDLALAGQSLTGQAEPQECGTRVFAAVRPVGLRERLYGWRPEVWGLLIVDPFSMVETSSGVNSV